MVSDTGMISARKIWRRIPERRKNYTPAELLAFGLETKLSVTAREFFYDIAYENLCVAKQHQCLVHVVKRVVNSGKSRIHTALDDHDGVRSFNVEHRHTVNRARLVGFGGRISYVVRADNQRNVGLREVAVDVIHFHQP